MSPVAVLFFFFFSRLVHSIPVLYKSLVVQVAGARTFFCFRLILLPTFRFQAIPFLIGSIYPFNCIFYIPIFVPPPALSYFRSQCIFYPIECISTRIEFGSYVVQHLIDWARVHWTGLFVNLCNRGFGNHIHTHIPFVT